MDVVGYITIVMAKQYSRKRVMGMRGLIDIRYMEGKSLWWGAVTRYECQFTVISFTPIPPQTRIQLA